MMDIVIVGGRKYFIAFTKRQPVIDEREAGGCVLGQSDILRVAADVTGNRAACFQRHILFGTLEERGLHRYKWICVELPAILLDCFANGTGMRRQIEKAKVSVVRREIELSAHSSPIGVTSGGRLRLFGMCQQRRECSGGNRERTANQKIAAGHGHGVSPRCGYETKWPACRKAIRKLRSNQNQQRSGIPCGQVATLSVSARSGMAE